jgi:hypothetical protein
MHPLHAHVSAEGEELFSLANETAIIAQADGFRAQHLPNSANSIELGAGTECQTPPW